MIISLRDTFHFCMVQGDYSKISIKVYRNFNLIQEGNISLDIKLNKPHNTGITIVCYLEYDSVLEIDKDPNIYYE